LEIPLISAVFSFNDGYRSSTLTLPDLFGEAHGNLQTSEDFGQHKQDDQQENNGRT